MSCPNLFKILKNKKGLTLSLSKGFTLIELLVVMGILAILLSIVLIAINPARQFGQANNAKRQSDVTAILNAIGAYAADHAGQLPAGIPVAPAAAADANTTTICNGIMPTYISAVPSDPTQNNGTAITNCTGAPATGYTVQQDANKRVTVAATTADNGATITVTR